MKIHLRKIEYTLSILLLILILSSCVSTKSINIEIPQKSKKELPDYIQSLLLVSRVVDEQFTNIKSDSLQKIFYKENFNYDTTIYDVAAIDTTLKALGELLFESGRYDYVIPENRFLEFEKGSFLVSELPWTEVNFLCETYKTDAIISIDYFKTKVFTDFEKDNYFDPFKNGFRSASFASMKVYYEALLRVYDPQLERVLVREFFRDTLFWEDSEVSTKELFKRFTPVKAALSEAGVAIAMDFSENISTNWRNESRSYFASGDSNLKKAVQSVNAGDWESAMVLWKETAENTKSKSLKSKAELNLSVGYELQGDLDKAIEWALMSYNNMYRINTYNYLEVLNRRKNEIKKQQP